MRIGYARVSTDDQSLDLQLDALKKAGCKRVFTDKASAAKGNRPGLADAVSHLRSGDVLVIWKLDRLGRTVKGPVDFVAELRGCGAQFRSLTDGIDTTTPAGRLFFHVMASLAQMERELLAETLRAALNELATVAPARINSRSGSQRQICATVCRVQSMEVLCVVHRHRREMPPYPRESGQAAAR